MSDVWRCEHKPRCGCAEVAEACSRQLADALNKRNAAHAGALRVAQENADAARAESARLKAERDEWKRLAQLADHNCTAAESRAAALLRRVEALEGALRQIENATGLCPVSYTPAMMLDAAQSLARAALSAPAAEGPHEG